MTLTLNSKIKQTKNHIRVQIEKKKIELDKLLERDLILLKYNTY